MRPIDLPGGKKKSVVVGWRRWVLTEVRIAVQGVVDKE